MSDKCLNSPFQGDMKPAPSPHAMANGNHSEISELNKPEDTSVLSTHFYDETLKYSPAALATPMGTAIPNVGKGFKRDQ